ncbi:hypothetical protein EBN88_17435 [Streptomyces triticirhizae]|uniref:DUF3592 domain-containing protein n=1 Tax=Streptomyces triticirhizae TaxID=2483353 RepID=A0A3M2LQ37_9ACTN|nr:hypothetical protein EBN88_17435 [Streptomyces triticirhizae]
MLMWLVCVPVAWFVLQLVEDVPVRQARIIAAAFDWHGEKGTVTVSESKRVYEGGGRGGGSMRTHCFGTFVPDDGTAPLTNIRVHVGDCEIGRVAEARLIPKDPSSWMIPNKTDQAYAGDGWGQPLVLLLFMGLFLLIAGGPFVLCAALFPVMILLALYRRWRPTTD